MKIDFFYDLPDIPLRLPVILVLLQLLARDICGYRGGEGRENSKNIKFFLKPLATIIKVYIICHLLEVMRVLMRV